MHSLGWSECDFIIVSGDAYVDHSSFAAALLGRLLESGGYKTGILAQPDYKNIEDFKRLGKPRLAFLVSAGAMDSMVANYTANKKPRSQDAYSHGGIAGKRPDRAIISYTAKLREAYKGIPVIIGGIEASLRRFAHYDYWSDTVKRSILLDSKADLLVYGMGEKPILEIAEQLASGKSVKDLRGIRGTCWRCGKKIELPLANETAQNTIDQSTQPTNDYEDRKIIFLPPFSEIAQNTPESKSLFAVSFVLQEQNTDAINAAILVEQSEERYVVQEPPALPLEQTEFDRVMELPFTRRIHPMYETPAENGKIGIPALNEVLFSLTSCRGCFGACAFCAITFHQGRRIQTRSHESLERETFLLTKHPEFKGYIHDVGGPTANFRQDACTKQKKNGVCKDRQCLGTEPCPFLEADHGDYISLLRRLRSISGIKKVFVRSGIRFDYVRADLKNGAGFLRELCEYHVSGQLKTAPEHVSNSVLSLMRKSNHQTYEQFCAEFTRINLELGKKQYIVPYYIAAHPGAGINEALENALYLKKTHFIPDQVQDFYPTPGSLATCMYYTELNPHTCKKLHVAKGERERKLQRALLQFNKPENRALVREALEKVGKSTIIRKLLSDSTT